MLILFLRLTRFIEFVYYQGLFQSTLILSALAVYYNSIATLPIDQRSQDFPIGALVLSIQAVE